VLPDEQPHYVTKRKKKRMPRKIRINDPYNTMGSSQPQVNQMRRNTLKRLAEAVKNAPDEESRKRIEAYRKGVKANFESGFPVDDNGVNRAAEPYRNLTRSDCARIWRPDCPEAKDPNRRA
jgi:hypothetical protein